MLARVKEGSNHVQSFTQLIIKRVGPGQQQYRGRYSSLVNRSLFKTR